MASMPSSTDAIPDLPNPINTISNSSNPPDDLVARDDREPAAKCIILGENVRMTESASFDLHQDLTLAGQLQRHLLQSQRAALLFENSMLVRLRKRHRGCCESAEGWKLGVKNDGLV